MRVCVRENARDRLNSSVLCEEGGERSPGLLEKGLNPVCVCACVCVREREEEKERGYMTLLTMRDNGQRCRRMRTKGDWSCWRNDVEGESGGEKSEGRCRNKDNDSGRMERGSSSGSQ